MRTQIASYHLCYDDPLEVRDRRSMARFRLRLWLARGRPAVALVGPLGGDRDGPDCRPWMPQVAQAVLWGYLAQGADPHLVAHDPNGDLWQVRLRPCGPRFFDRPELRCLARGELEELTGPLGPED